MSNLPALLDSRPLVGFQLDATHLHTVLAQLIEGQQRLGADLDTTNRRLDGVEQTVRDLSAFAQRTSTLLDSLGTAEEIRNIAQHVRELDESVAQLVNSDLRDLHRSMDTVQNRLGGVERAQDEQANRAEQNAANLRRDVDVLSNNQRALATDLEGVSTEVGRVSRSVDDQAGLQDALARLDRVERETIPKIAGEMDQLNRLADENFKAVEGAVRQIDEDTKRSRADLANTRAELNGVDNDVAHKINKLKEESDSKFAMLLQLMQTFERNSQQFEAHLAEAGRVLQNPRVVSRPVSEASSPAYRPTAGGGGGGLRSGSSYGGSGAYVGNTSGREY